MVADLAMRTAALGMGAQQTRIDVIAANLANAGTTAYERREAIFGEMISQTIGKKVGANTSDSGTLSPVGTAIPLGVQLVGVTRISEQGSLMNTGNTLDVAIQGKGYFLVTLPSGETAYTRAGSLSLSSDGGIVTPEGYTVQPGITVSTEATSITINESGEVLLTTAGETAPTSAGQFQLALFANTAGLEPIGDNLFKETAASGSASTSVPNATGYGKLKQGFLESSNVNSIKSITDLIEAQRHFEMNSKVIQTEDQVLATIAQLK